MGSRWPWPRPPRAAAGAPRTPPLLALAGPRAPRPGRRRVRAIGCPPSRTETQSRAARRVPATAAGPPGAPRRAPREGPAAASPAPRADPREAAGRRLRDRERLAEGSREGREGQRGRGQPPGKGRRTCLPWRPAVPPAAPRDAAPGSSRCCSRPLRTAACPGATRPGTGPATLQGTAARGWLRRGTGIPRRPPGWRPPPRPRCRVPERPAPACCDRPCCPR